MHRLLYCVSAVLFFLLLDGCATSSAGGYPCENCRYGYRRISRRHGESSFTCVIDGKVVDCKKNAPECPECARRIQEPKQD